MTFAVMTCPVTERAEMADEFNALLGKAEDREATPGATHHTVETVKVEEPAPAPVKVIPPAPATPISKDDFYGMAERIAFASAIA